MQLPIDNQEIIAEIWADKTKFSLSQAAALWVGESPPHHYISDKEHPGYDESVSFTESFKDINLFNTMLNRLRAAVIKYELDVSYLPSYEYNHLGKKIYDEEEPDLYKTYVKKEELKRWSELQGTYPTFLFGESVRAYRWAKISALFEDPTESIEDPDNSLFTNELAIALKAWDHFYFQKNIDTSSNQKKQLNKWIEEKFRYSEIENNRHLVRLYKAGINRISTLINRAPHKARKPEVIKKRNLTYDFKDEKKE